MHTPISIDRTKYCFVCLINGTKTKSGWGVKTRSKCSVCDVPLCSSRADRNCFRLYHDFYHSQMNRYAGINTEPNQNFQGGNFCNFISQGWGDIYSRPITFLSWVPVFYKFYFNCILIENCEIYRISIQIKMQVDFAYFLHNRIFQA